MTSPIAKTSRSSQGPSTYVVECHRLQTKSKMACHLLILFFWSLCSLSSLSIDYLIPFTTPESCKTNQYFRFSSLSCEDCGSPGQERSNDGFSCICQTGYINKGCPPSKKNVCEPCNSGSRNRTSSLDGSFCIKCPTDVGFNVTTGTCNICPSGSVAIDRSRDGAKLSTRKCERCNDSVCFPCTGDGFVMSEGVCYDSVLKETSSMYKVEYGDKSFHSAFFRSNLRASQALCYKTDTNCLSAVRKSLCTVGLQSGWICL